MRAVNCRFQVEFRACIQANLSNATAPGRRLNPFEFRACIRALQPGEERMVGGS